MSLTRLLTLTVIILSACNTVSYPEERGIRLQDCDNDDEDCDPYEEIIGVTNQTKAMFTAQYMVEDAYNERFGDLFNKRTTIYWVRTVCPEDGLYKVIHNKECVYGKMWSCDEMYVAVSNGDSKRTCGSALLHEFGHCMLMEMGVNADTDHSNNAFWSVIEEAQDLSCDRDW